MSSRNVQLVSDSFSFMLNLGLSYETTDQYVNMSLSDCENLVDNLCESGVEKDSIEEMGSVLTDLCLFASAICGEDLDESCLLSVKLSETREPEAIYPPGIFQKDGELFIKIGKNQVKIEQNGDQFSVAGMKAKLKCETKGGDTKYTEIGLRIIDFHTIYYVRCLTPRDSVFTQDEVENAIDMGKPLAQFLRQLPGGGGTKYVRLKDLGVGDFEIDSIIESKSQYSDFSIALVDGRVVDPNYHLKMHIGAQLKAGVALEGATKFYKGKILKIMSITPQDNRTIVKCKIEPKNRIVIGSNLLAGSTIKALPLDSHASIPL